MTFFTKAFGNFVELHEQRFLAAYTYVGMS
jgi:hypothetical protein